MNAKPASVHDKSELSSQEKASLSARIRRFLAAPIFEDDEEKTRVAGLLNGALLVILATTVVGSAIVIVVEPEELIFNVMFGIILTAIFLALRSFLHRGHVKVIGLLLSLATWAAITSLLYISGGLGNTAVIGYFLLTGVSGLLLGEQIGMALGALNFLTIVGLFYAELIGLISVRAATRPTDLAMLLISIVLSSIMVRFIVRHIAQSLERARRNERDLAERNRELEASQRVTFSASERTSPDELLGLVVDLIRDQFKLYHVQVYIVDEAQNAAVLRESTGYAGYRLLQENHHIPLDHPSLVTKVIREGKPVLVADVSQDPDFMPNPLLPNTKSELVVPLRLGDRVIGVLDAQARTPGHFTERTVALFQTMSHQITFLFENSELLERVSEQAEALNLFANQLRTAADIARRLGVILDFDRLLHQTVELIRKRFGLYHVHIYVLDEMTEELVVRAGSGEVGRVLEERRHSIPLNKEKSLVARAARTQETIVVDDTDLEADFMPNPLLPNTRSELSVPLMAGDNMLGVLDIQDDQSGRFSWIDIDTFTALANQIATALQNARLFEEQKQTKEALQESEDRYRDLVEHSHDMISTHDLTGRILSMNRGAAELLGYDQSAILKKNIRDILAPEVRDEFEVYLATIREHGVASGLMLVQTKSGEKRFWEYNNTLRTEGVDTPIVRGMAHDITERRKAEEERARFTNQLRTAAELAKRINAILEPDQLLQEVATQLHDRFNLYHVHIYLLDEKTRDLTMQAGSGLAGQVLRKQGHKISLDRKKSLVARAARNREIVSVSDTSTDPNFMPNPLLPKTRSEVAIPLITGGKVLGVLDVQDDQSNRFTQADLDTFSTLAGQIATALQNAAYFEDLQKSARQLRAMNHLRNKLWDKMDLELRSPLNSIIGYSEIMLTAHNGDLPPKTLEYVQGIYNNGQYLRSIIVDILDLMKIEAGHMTLDLEEVEIKSLVEDVSLSATGLLRNKPVELIVEIDKDLPPIQGDRLRLHQALNKIVANAVKSTAEGHISLHAFAEHNSQDDNGWVCIEIQDTSVGMSEINAGEASDTEGADGASLGLTITHQLVQMHGGEFDTHSQPGQGSTFTVRLPIQSQTIEASASGD